MQLTTAGEGKLVFFHGMTGFINHTPELASCLGMSSWATQNASMVFVFLGFFYVLLCFILIYLIFVVINLIKLDG